MRRIVFDFDGTLLDSSYRHVVVMRGCLEEAGYTDVSLDDYLEYKADGNSGFSYLTNVLGLSENRAKSVSDAWISRIENRNYLSLDKLYEDTISVVRNLSEDSELYLLSARQREDELLYQLETLGVYHFFKKIICVSPKNALREKTKALIDLNADLIVGDTEVDKKAADAAGVKAYILHRGFRSEKYWKEMCVKSMNNLMSFEY